MEWVSKKNGIKMGDIISKFKVENLNRPNKAVIYPFALILLLGFGFLNYKRTKKHINNAKQTF